jgi:hypothetical protein
MNKRQPSLIQMTPAVDKGRKTVSGGVGIVDKKLAHPNQRTRRINK